MSNFDAFVSSLSEEQKEALMKGVMESAEKPPVEVTADLGREEIQELGRKKPPAKPRPRRAVVNDDFTVTRPEGSKGSGKQPVRAKQNQWKDIGENKEEGFDPEKFERLGKTARTRPPKVKVEIDCHICHKTFEIDEDLVYGEFTRCNRCTG
jgi:hypothetical protein